MRLLLLSCLIAWSFILPAAAAIPTDEKRIALVIGAGKYQYAQPLANPVNDARRLSEALRHVNFAVEEVYDPDYARLSESLREFGIRAREADAALIFYAGHGVQVNGENYLVPVDARLERERDLVYEALPLGLLLGELSQAKTVGVMILDACRNNPFRERMDRSMKVAGRAASTNQGLARVDKVPRNTLVAMATRADQIAEDGDGENSPFTQAIIGHLQVPGLELSLFFRSVRDTVLRATANRQEPYVFSSLGAKPFYFYPRPPNRSPQIGAITPLTVSDTDGPVRLGIPRPVDPDDDPLTVRIIDLPRAGEIRIDGKVVGKNQVVSLEKFMSATYKHDGTTTGSVGTFDFMVDDGRGAFAIGSLPITVNPTNRPPIVEPRRVVKIYPAYLGISPPTDPDGDPLAITISGLPSQGTIQSGTRTLRIGDSVRTEELARLVYVPDSDAEGDVGSVRYVVEDGRGGKAEGRLRVRVASLRDSTGLLSQKSLMADLRARAGTEPGIVSLLQVLPPLLAKSGAPDGSEGFAGDSGVVQRGGTGFLTGNAAPAKDGDMRAGQRPAAPAELKPSEPLSGGASEPARRQGKRVRVQ
jgi:hypothetical protein